MSQYNHTAIEKKWRENWEKHPINVNDGKKEKYYCLDMFPYPSGSGLHVGHWRGYVISDVWSRYQLLRGKYVIHPMGWDAFGLPAENYAIKMGVHPAISTESNIKNIKRQINEIAAIYDWDMEVNTTDPAFYKWTQWIFVQMFKKGLAYEKEFPINWCPSCKTGLANEEVVNGCCERCGTPVTKKNLRQWMLKITAYADRLLNDLDKLDWPEKVKKMQTDWIGKSYGAEVDFGVEGRDEKITVYTTRPDTLYGATFMVLAPEHAMAKSLATDETREAVEKYIFDSSMRSNVDRLQDKEKTGVFTGTYAINPINGAKVPIWLSDYVLADYGTGAIMCVPAHDDRDFEFAKKFNIPIIQVIAKDGKEIENMNRLARLKCFIQAWYRSLPQTATTFQVGDYPRQDMRKLKLFRKALTGEPNPRELIFEQIPRIFETDSLSDTLKEVQKAKKDIDAHTERLKKDVAAAIKKSLGLQHNDNLQQGLKVWYENIPEKAKNSILPATSQSLFNCIRDVISGKSMDLIEKLAKTATNFFIEDWNDKTKDEFESTLKTLVADLKKKEEAADTPQSKKITLPGESGAKEYFYDFDPNELSPSGVFFQSALDDMMDEYGALDNSEKIGILMNLVKKLMG